ncbi:E3 ubiquitin-protein ligase makorin-2 isoform 1 [Achlya hypogyna]|uniref:E3 ubiquitin-protein ligase makorin-2 isoform 1 n=1 Tax=Achlya hypogyna TaxID=1202772 RepID=A0A1V9YDA4_ACHHY|nr:E3 ubiquitin-protein ligase makorin-2 isoform 1 [Achlya hypogyna]
MSSSSRRAVCTFYLQGTCTKGTSCRFAHPPCKFFRDGTCTKGSACRFEHTTASSSTGSRVSAPVVHTIEPSVPKSHASAPKSSLSAPQSSVSAPKSDRIVTGEINGLAFQAELLDPADVSAFVRRDYDEETDYSYVEPESIEESSPYDEYHTYAAAKSKFQAQLDDLERKMAVLTATKSVPIDTEDDTDSDASLHRRVSVEAEYSDIQPAAPPKQCKFHLQGACRFGDACVYSHARGLCPDEGLLMDKELHASQDVECNICMDLILRAGERFGLLPHCYHAFCLKCVRDKDRIAKLRECPVCHADAPFIVPCNRLVSDPARKAKIIADYMANLAQIPCRHFNLGRGKCPFGHGCFYEHRFPDGKLAPRLDDKPPMARRLQSA